MLAPDVVLVFPGGQLEGREAWLESRRQQSPDQLAEAVEADNVAESAGGVELTGRLVQRWAETGEVASEQPIRIVFTVENGLISRLELSPLSA
jgi:hypothetical protein